MNKDELMDKIDEWYENEEHEKIVSAILALPENELDDDILGQLAVAYNNTGEFKKAIAVLESQRPRLESWFKWQYRMGYALMYAADDEECENDEELRNTILDRARVCFARCMNMNPPEDYLEDCDMYIEMIEERLNEGEEDEEEEDEFAAELYSNEEMDAIEEHIKEHFGEFPTVYHEIHSPDIHVDICCVPPTEERNYYTLVTMGMGAHVMNIPDDLPKEQFGRAELVICLPRDWKLGETDDEWYWPIALIKNLARLPINCDTWLGWGHSVDNQEPFAPNTELCGSVLVRPADVDEEAEVCELPNGDNVRFFEILPLYRGEMNFKIDASAEALLERMKGVSHIVDVNRENTCDSFEINEKSGPADFSSSAFDSAEFHIDSIRSKNLPLDEITGCNHIAIFLRWAISRNLYAPEFRKHFPDVINGVLDGSLTDLRPFIMEQFGGQLLSFLFNYEGYRFAYCYYSDSEDIDFFYPCDVDSYAEGYFGTERYNSEEFQDEAYLFVPFDEDYYNGLSAVIERRYLTFRAEFDKEQAAMNSNYADTVMRGLLGCPCTCCYPDRAEEVRAEFEAAKLRGKEKGFTPVLVIHDTDGDSDNAEGLEDILSGFIFSNPITIAEVPVRDESEVCEWFTSWFGARALPPVKADASRFEQCYGTAPLIARCIDTEPAPVLLVPAENGLFHHMEADPALNESGEEPLVLEHSDTELLPALVHFLGCRYKLFAPAEDDREITLAYRAACERGKKEGFTPVLISIDEELLKRMINASGCSDSSAEFGFSSERLTEFRRNHPAADVSAADSLTAGKDLSGALVENDPLTRFLGCWNFRENRTLPLVLAEIPENEPWRALNYLPAFEHIQSGTCSLCDAAKKWYEEYGAIPATIGANTLEFTVSRPADRSSAMGLATEMFALCPDLSRNSTLAELAGSLVGSTVWFFGWQN